MLVPVKVPDVGAGSQALRLSAWFVEPGDRIEPGEPLFEILISGITCDVPARDKGRLARVEKSLDAVVAPGDVVAWIEADRAADSPATSESP